MPTALIDRQRVSETTVKWVGPRPITFIQFLDMFGPKDYVELVNGAVEEKPLVQFEHERLYGWLFRVLGLYAKQLDQGIVLGSRTAVEINQFGGRLPDLFFVPKERIDIVQQT